MKPYLIFLTISLLMLGCSKSDNKIDCNSGFSLAVVTSDEVTALSVAASNYSQDPTPGNCEKYKTALNAYVDVLEKFEDCARTQGSIEEWKQYINDSRQNINQLQCQ